MCCPKTISCSEFLPYMKLAKLKLLKTIRQKNERRATYQARKAAWIGVRSANQVWVECLKTGKTHGICKNNGRPPKPTEEREIKIAEEAYTKYLVPASTPEKYIEKGY